MKNEKVKIGDLIEQVDKRNTDLSINNLYGVSIDKMFIKSIANTIGTDMSNYKIVNKGQFAYGTVTSRNGDKVSIALLEDDQCIISSSYIVFKIVKKERIEPEYLMLYFKRPEFDRYARFKSHGSAREIFDFEQLCETLIELPDIKTQKKIIARHKSINKRIELLKQINDNLIAQANNIYKYFFENFAFSNGVMPKSWHDATLYDISKDIICGKTPLTSNAEYYGQEIPFITIPDMHDCIYVLETERYLSQKGAMSQKKQLLPKNTICVSCIATVGLVCLTDEISQTNQQINSIICKDNISPFYVYLKMTKMKEYLEQLGAGGSTTLNISKSLFERIEILYPDKETINIFDQSVSPIFNTMRNNQREIKVLKKIKSNILSKLSC